MIIRWKNGGLIVGRDWIRGPRCWCVEIHWNDRQALTGIPVPKGELLHADMVAVRWVFPPLRQLRCERYRMHWREFA